MDLLEFKEAFLAKSEKMKAEARKQQEDIAAGLRKKALLKEGPADGKRLVIPFDMDLISIPEGEYKATGEIFNDFSIFTYNVTS
ncbi:hypothetical protein [Flavitalea sp.]|nr:hypothetical protein [Flavitalea sp.]